MASITAFQCITTAFLLCVSLFRGHNFREDYRKLGTLSSVFPTAKIVAMTATATKEYQTSIMKSLNMKDPKLVITNPDRPNIFYEVQQRPSYLKQSNINQFEDILSPIADELIIANIKMPVTIIYSSLEMCGVGYAFLERKLGDHQFYPIGAPQIPQNRLFAQFHSPQTDKMKHKLISSIVSESCKQRVIFATVAFGMGVDSPCVERIIHFGVPRTMESFFQESGRAGRDGRPATSTLYFNNTDIGASVEGMQPIMRDYCKTLKMSAEEKLCLATLVLVFQVLETNTAAVTYVELTVSALNVLSYIKMFSPLKTFTSLIMNFFFLENRWKI